MDPALEVFHLGLYVREVEVLGDGLLAFGVGEGLCFLVGGVVCGADAELVLEGAALLAIEGIDADSEPARITHERTGVKARTHARVLCHGILKRHFSVLVLGNSGGGVYIGPAVNIAIARHVEAYLLRECSAAWKRHAEAHRIRKPRATGNRRRVFEFTFFCGIDHVLESRPIRNDRDETMRAIERYASERFQIQKSPFAAPKRHNGADYMGGLHAGKNTRLDRPVEAAAEQHRLAGQLALT